MTTNKYEVRELISEHCDINPLVLEEFLSKLNTDDLEVLKMIIQDSYTSGSINSDEVNW